MPRKYRTDRRADTAIAHRSRASASTARQRVLQSLKVPGRRGARLESFFGEKRGRRINGLAERALRLLHEHALW